MNLDDILSFTDHTLQPEEVLGEAVFHFGLPKQLEQIGWRTDSNNSTFKPILQNAMIRNGHTLMQYHDENDLEDLDNDLQDLIKQCQKQCLPFDCKVEEKDINFSTQQISYHSFPVKRRQSFLLISNSGESSKKSKNRDEELHAHVLTIRTALTDRQKMELKQVQSTDHSSRRGLEADVTWLKLNAPRTICFISKYSLHNFFADVLRFAQIRYGDNDDQFDEFLNHCIFTPITSLGQQIQVKISSLENNLCFNYDSTFTTTTDKLSNQNPTLNILPATISKQRCLDAITFLFEPTIMNRRIAIVSDSITLLSFCLKEFEELLISIPDWNGIVHPILHHTDLHSIIAKEQRKYIIPVQRRMSHILSMTDFHIIDLDGDEGSKERSSSRLSKWLPSGTRSRSKQQSRSINSSDWLDRNMFEFNFNLFHNVGRIEVVNDTHSGDLSFESLDVSERSWSIQEIIPEIQSNQVKKPTKVPSKRRSILFGTKKKLLSSTVKDVPSSKVRESIESSMNEDIGIVPQLPKLEEYQIGPIGDEEEATNDTITAVDQPLSRNKEEEKWQDVRIRMEKSRGNIDIIKQRKRSRRIGRIFEDGGVEEMSDYDGDGDSPDALSIIAQNLEAKEMIETLQTPRSHVTGFTSTTESMPLTPTIAQNVRTSKQQQESSSPQPPPPPPAPSPERSRTPVIRSSGFDWLEDVECMQAQLQQTIQRLEFENSQQVNTSDQNDEEYARIWKAFYSTPPPPTSSNRSLFVFDNVIDDDLRTEFHKINQWRNDVQNRSNSNSNLPQPNDSMTKENLFDDGRNHRRRRNKSWNSL